MNQSDQDIRLQAMLWLKEQNRKNGEILPRQILTQGFDYRGQNITLIGSRGIWYPKGFDMPISMPPTTSISWASALTIGSVSERIYWKKKTAPCYTMACRR